VHLVCVYVSAYKFYVLIFTVCTVHATLKKKGRCVHLLQGHVDLLYFDESYCWLEFCRRSSGMLLDLSVIFCRGVVEAHETCAYAFALCSSTKDTLLTKVVSKYSIAHARDIVNALCHFLATLLEDCFKYTGHIHNALRHVACVFS